MQMAGPLSGKVALVTGGTRGIGAAVAHRLAEEGADVAISYRRSEERAAKVVAALDAVGVRAAAFEVDQSDPQHAKDVVADTVERFGRLDILVNNAGAYVIGLVDDPDVDEAALARQLATNVAGVAAITRAAAAVLPEGGRIITIGSLGADRVGFPGLADYAATKAAVAAYGRGWARDLGPRQITSNVIQPGAVDTDMNPADGPAADFVRSMTPLGRYARPDEVAALVAFLAGPEAAYISGAVINFDGGQSA
jgi:3-oxoacyl-[acyl-carrier protein] reductase